MRPTASSVNNPVSLERLLERARPVGGSETGLATLLQSLDVTTLLSDVWQHFTSDDEFNTRLTTLASVSANGFFRLFLTAPPNRQHLRIHAWNERVEIDAYDIHNHRWPFASRLLRGALQVDEFVLDPAGDHAVYRYRHEPLATGSRLTLLGESRLRLSASATYRTDTTYMSAAATLHRVVPSSDGLTLTILLEGEASRQITDVYSRRELASGFQDIPRITVAEVRRTLENIVSALS